MRLGFSTLAQLCNSTLGGNVGGEVLRGLQTTDRDDVDDVALAHFREVIELSVHAEEGAAKCHAHRAIECCGINLGQRSGRGTEAGIVYGSVEATVLVECELHEVFVVFKFARVDEYEVGGTTSVLDDLNGFVALFFANVRDDDRVTILAETFGDGASDAVARTGDGDNLSVVTHSVSSLRCDLLPGISSQFGVTNPYHYRG